METIKMEHAIEINYNIDDIKLEPDQHEESDYRVMEVTPSALELREEVTGSKKQTCCWCKESYDLNADIELKHSVEKTCQSTPDPSLCNTCQKIFKCQVILCDVNTMAEQYESEAINGRYTYTPSLEHKLFYNIQSKSSVKKHYQCDICHKIIYDRYTFIRHIKNGHQRKVEKFLLCSKNCDNFKYGHMHDDVITAPALTCNICNESCTSIKHLKSHIRSHEDIEFVCDLCRKRFKGTDMFRTHLMDHMEKKFKCVICQRQYMTKNMLSHKLFHIGFSVHHNVNCDKRKERRRRKKSDEYEKQPNRSFICDICSKSFTFANNLKRHVKDFHSSDSPQIECEICGKIFKRRCNLVLHLQTHSDRRQFVCEICDKHFKRFEHLRNHNVLHTGEQPFTCQICLRRFNRQSNLIAHARMHDSGPLKCPICCTELTNKHHFDIHVRIHPEYKPHTCDICFESYATKERLTKHKDSHKRKGYVCKLCSAKFFYKWELQEHITLIHA